MILCSDQAWWLYLSIALVALYGFGLFAWWWGRQGKASPMFVYVTLLMAAIAGDYALAWYARTLRFIDHSRYRELLMSWLWAARMYLLLAMLVMITVHMTYRVWGAGRSSTQRRRVGDSDGSV